MKRIKYILVALTIMFLNQACSGAKFEGINGTSLNGALSEEGSEVIDELDEIRLSPTPKLMAAGGEVLPTQENTDIRVESVMGTATLSSSVTVNGIRVDSGYVSQQGWWAQYYRENRVIR